MIKQLNQAISIGDQAKAKEIANLIEDLDTVDEQDVSPLMCAAGCEDYALCLYLIKQGADVNLQNTSGSTALHMAVLESVANAILSDNKLGNENTSIVSALLEKGANPYLVDSLGHSAIDIANDSESEILLSVLTKVSEQ